MDLPNTNRSSLLEELKKELDDQCIDFSDNIQQEVMWEEIAMSDEVAMENYLEKHSLTVDQISVLVDKRKVFPCYFGSALKVEGVEAFLRGLQIYMQPTIFNEEFGARVYKIGRDVQGNRLTYLKITSGILKVKMPLTMQVNLLEESGGKEVIEKIDQIRIYNGNQYRVEEEVGAGVICAVTGLTRSFPGQGMGVESKRGNLTPLLEPVLHYRLLLDQKDQPFATYLKLKQLEEEEPQLHLIWEKDKNEIHAKVMGEIQLEILQRIIYERFGLEVSFGEGSIVYKETLTEATIGLGHFEPLRHYAEVQLLMEPLPRGSGIVVECACSEDLLERNWQRLIQTHLEEKVHLGVLTGAEITDIKITLIAGKAHNKHTEGGDFREATYRAVRQGLKMGESVLLEPYYIFRLEVPMDMIGRAMRSEERRVGKEC